MTTIWIVPFALGAIGAVLYAAAWLVSRRFDRKYAHLSRRGLLEAEQRAPPASEAAKRPAIPVPLFHPEEWRMQSARDALASERLDRSIHRYGEQRTRRAAQAEKPDGPSPS